LEGKTHGASSLGFRWAVVAFVVAGEIFRVVQYLWRQAFWGDEVAVLENTLRYPARVLPFVRLEAYPAHVAAPPLFLLATQWMGDHFHYSEYAVRLLPVICSLAALPLFAAAAWRLVSPAAAAWAVGLFALSDALIFQAANVKPYSGDVLVAVLIILLATGSKDFTPQLRLLLVAGLATAAVWFSYTTVFCFAAAVLALGWELRWRGWRWLGVCVVPAASFWAVNHFSMRVQRDARLDSLWIHAFPDFSRPWTIPAWLFGSTLEIFREQMYPIGQIMAAAAVVGVWSLRGINRRPVLILLGAPLILNLMAALARQYPYSGTRLSLFTSPSLCLLCGAGAAGAAELWQRWGRVFQAVMACVLVSAAAVAVYGLFVPQNKGNLRDTVAFLNQHRKSNEPVYLEGGQTGGAMEWYVPNSDRLMRMAVNLTDPIPGSGFWMVICYVPRNERDVKAAMTQPDAVVDESRSFHTDGGDVLWFAPRRGAGN